MSTPPDGPAPNPAEPTPPGQPAPTPDDRRDNIRSEPHDPRAAGAPYGDLPYDSGGETSSGLRSRTDLPGLLLIILGALSIVGALFMGFRAVQVALTSEQEFQRQL